MLPDRVVSVLQSEFGDSRVEAVPPAMAGEDFARYGRTDAEIPSMLFWLGAVDPEQFAAAERDGKKLPALHSSLFAPLPKPAIEMGVGAFTALTRALLPVKRD